MTPKGASGLTRSKSLQSFHYLNGLYDPKCKELKDMRKSALPIDDLDTLGQDSGNDPQVAEHSHKDWPDNIVDQIHLLNENPYADSLYYHSMRFNFPIKLPMTLFYKSAKHRKKSTG